MILCDPSNKPWTCGQSHSVAFPDCFSGDFGFPSEGVSVFVGESEAVGALPGPEGKLPGNGDDVPSQRKSHILVASAKKNKGKISVNIIPLFGEKT